MKSCRGECFKPLRKNERPHNVNSRDKCYCTAGGNGYCNHMLTVIVCSVNRKLVRVHTILLTLLAAFAFQVTFLSDPFKGFPSKMCLSLFFKYK